MNCLIADIQYVLLVIATLVYMVEDIDLNVYLHARFVIEWYVAFY